MDGRSFYLAVLLMFVLVPAGFGHTPGISKGSYRLEGRDIFVDLVFSVEELTGALPETDTNRDGTVNETELKVGQEYIVKNILNRLEMQAPEGNCTGSILEVALTEQDGVMVRAAYQCLQAPPHLSFRLLFFDILFHGHRHIVTASSGTETVETILYRGNTEFQLPANRMQTQTVSGRISVLQFFLLGVGHILSGIDHLVFLFGLVLVGGRIRRLCWIVTAFTLGHAVTLCLAALQIIAPPPGWIEPLIAVSIVYIGVENWFIKNAERRWLVTLPFGLIHGFGFAGALQEIALPQDLVIPALAAFNLGVEAGQVAFLAVVLPLILQLRQRQWFASYFTKGLSAGIAVAGAWWLVIRVG